MLNLVSTSDLLQIVTASGVSTINVHADFADYNGSTVVPGNQNTAITTATTTTVVSSPAASTQRAVKSLIVFNSHASSSDLITIQLTNASSTITLFVYTLNAGETIMYGEDGKFYVIDATGQIKTAPGNVLTSPVINGTPSGTGIPTITLKKGTGLGDDYTTTSTSYVDVDATNLAYTVTIPVGWKLAISSSGAAYVGTANTNYGLSLYDAATLVEFVGISPTPYPASSFALNWVINGDGSSHTVKLQMKTFTAADAILVDNSSSTRLPTMLFILSPSN